MKKIQLFILLSILCIELRGQLTKTNSKSLLEISIGLGKVNSIGQGDFIIEGTCVDCNYKAIRNFGHEFNSKITLNKKFSERHELLYGIGLNFWKHEVELINAWTGSTLENYSNTLTLFDLIAGYKFTVKEFGSNYLYVENIIHGEINFNSEFRRFRFSVEPGIGINVGINESLRLLSVISYKQSLTNFSGSNSRIHRPFNLGLKIGILKNI